MAAVVHTDAPAIFNSFNYNEAEDDVQFVKVEPTGGFTSNTPVTFEIPGNSASYIDLHRSYIHVGCHIEQTDRLGNPLPKQHAKYPSTVRQLVVPEKKDNDDDDDDDDNAHDQAEQGQNNGDTVTTARSKRHAMASDTIDFILENTPSSLPKKRKKRRAIPDDNEAEVQEAENAMNAEDMTYEKLEQIKHSAMRSYIMAQNVRDQAEAAKGTADYDRLNGKAVAEMLVAEHWMKLAYDARLNFLRESDVPSAIIPVDNVLHSMWSDVEVYMNNTKVNDSNRKYMYRAYIEAILNNSNATKIFQLQSTGFYGDHGNKDMFHTFTGNHGMEHRYNKFKGNKFVEMNGFLHDDVMGVSASIVNAVRTDIKLYPNQDNQRLQTFGNDVFGRLIVDEIWMMICKRKMTESVILAHNEIMQGKTASYPFKKAEMGVFLAKKGSHSIRISNPYQSKIPTRLILAMVSAQAYAGSFKKNPLRFEHYNVRRAGFYIDNQSVCKPPYELDPGRGKFIEPYQELYSILGKAGEDRDIGLTPEDYVNGFFLLPFDCAPTSSGNLEYIGNKKYGNCSIEIEFGQPLPEDINLISYGVFPYLLEIDAARNVFTHPFHQPAANV